MKSKLLLIISVCLNLALGFQVLNLLGERGKTVSDVMAVPDRRESDAAVAQRPESARRRPSLPDATRVEPFDWRQIESEDYRQYLANLRAIGCPDKTVRDIIVADVNDLFAIKAASVTSSNQYQYWKKEPMSRSEEQAKELRDLYAQKREVLKALGVGAQNFADLLGEAFRDTMEEREMELAFLPESKRQQVKETLFEQARRQMAEGNDVSRYGTIELETQARVSSLLTPEEYKEYELRCSTDAQQLRGVLDAVALTEPEFRAIFDSWRSLKASSPGTAEYREAAQTSETTVQQLLGPDRFQIYLSGVKLLGYAR
jgi:hypothetical protein